MLFSFFGAAALYMPDFRVRNAAAAMMLRCRQRYAFSLMLMPLSPRYAAAVTLLFYADVTLLLTPLDTFRCRARHDATAPPSCHADYFRAAAADASRRAMMFAATLFML